MNLEKTIVITNDPEPENPREWCNVGIMPCWHDRYILGDHEEWNRQGSQKSGIDGQYEFRQALIKALTEIMHKRRPALAVKNGYGMAAYDASDEEIPCPRGCNGPDNWALHEPTNCPHCSGEGTIESPFWVGEEPSDIAQALHIYTLQEHLVSPANRLITLPLYLYDHSGITMNTTGFHCGWDSGQVGWIFCTGADALHEWGNKRLTKRVIEKAEACLKAEVETYDQFLTGQVYGFTIYEHGAEEEPESGNDLASCWGFFSSDFGDDWETNGMADHWPEDWKTYRIVVNGDEEQEWREAA